MLDGSFKQLLGQPSAREFWCGLYFWLSIVAVALYGWIPMFCLAAWGMVSVWLLEAWSRRRERLRGANPAA